MKAVLRAGGGIGCRNWTGAVGRNYPEGYGWAIGGGVRFLRFLATLLSISIPKKMGRCSVRYCTLSTTTRHLGSDRAWPRKSLRTTRGKSADSKPWHCIASANRTHAAQEHSIDSATKLLSVRTTWGVSV